MCSKSSLITRNVFGCSTRKQLRFDVSYQFGFQGRNVNTKMAYLFFKYKRNDMKACKQCELSVLCLTHGFREMCKMLFAREQRKKGYYVNRGHGAYFCVTMALAYRNKVIPAFKATLRRRSRRCPERAPLVAVNNSFLKFRFYGEQKKMNKQCKRCKYSALCLRYKNITDWIATMLLRVPGAVRLTRCDRCHTYWLGSRQMPLPPCRGVWVHTHNNYCIRCPVCDASRHRGN